MPLQWDWPVMAPPSDFDMTKEKPTPPVSRILNDYIRIIPDNFLQAPVYLKLMMNQKIPECDEFFDFPEYIRRHTRKIRQADRSFRQLPEWFRELFRLPRGL